MKRGLILQSSKSLAKNDFYINLFKIPEVLHRLQEYRKFLTKNEFNIPIWMYCLTQDVKGFKGVPQNTLLNFIVNMGLFDRYIKKQNWPDYIMGSEPLISLILGIQTFEKQALLLTHAHEWSGMISLHQVTSNFKKNKQQPDIHFKTLKRSAKLLDLIHFLIKKETQNLELQFLNPDDKNFKLQIENSSCRVKNFLEEDEDLKWLWPSWQRFQLEKTKKPRTSNSPL